jgi:membrane protein YdbS with pleckstrin-like domain
MTSLHRKQLWVLRIRFAIAGLVLAPGLVVADIVLAQRGWMPGGLTGGIGAALILAAMWLMPRRRYRAWAYGQGEDELVVKHGLLIRKVTVVPFGRVQHIDIAQGPLERMFGLATLVLNTAGTRGSAVKLPGLLHADAEQMRDHIRAQIRQDLL